MPWPTAIRCSGGTDVSEKGFSRRTKAIGIVPEADLTSMSGTDAERWGKLSDKEKEAALYKFDKPGKERVITQQMRQEAFDNYETTDDHGMQIMGTAVDQGGQRLLQGEEFVGRASSLRRVLLFLASFRGLQDDVGHGQQEGYSGTYPQEDGTLTGRRPAIGGERFDRSLFRCADP